MNKNILKKLLFTLGAMLIFVPMAHCAMTFPNINIGMKTANTPQEFSQGLQIMVWLTILTLDPDFTRRLLDNINSELERTISSTGNQPVILCSSPIRIAFRKLIERTYPQITVMSYNEISSNTKAKSIGVIKIMPVKVS